MGIVLGSREEVLGAEGRVCCDLGMSWYRVEGQRVGSGSQARADGRVSVVGGEGLARDGSHSHNDVVVRAVHGSGKLIRRCL